MSGVPSRAQSFRPVAAVFGVALIVAAALKLTTVGLDVPSPANTVVPLWAIGLVPLFEVGLGLWLVSGTYRFGAWLAALPVTVLFALHSLALALEDRPSCGCFGSVTVPPMLTFLFDVVMAGLLVRCRPGWRGWPEGTPAGRMALGSAAVAAAVLGGMAAWAYGRYGSVAVAVAAASGAPVAVSPSVLELGTLSPGTMADGSLRVYNLSSEPVQASLATSSCGCAEVDGLPVIVPAGGSVDLRVRVSVSSSPGSFRRVGQLRTSAGNVKYQFRARVVPGGPGPVGENPKFATEGQ